MKSTTVESSSWTSQKQLEGNPPPPNKAFKWEEFVAGAGGGAFNVGATYPIHKLMFRQMRYGLNTRKAVDQLQKEGLRLLYRGFLPPLCQKAAANSIMFGGYETYGQLLMTKYPDLDQQLAKSTGAVLAGVNEAMLLTPFERVQVLLQDKHYNHKLKNSYHAVSLIWKTYGISEFYRGVSIIVIRNSVSNIVFFAAKEKASSVLPKLDNQPYKKYLTDFVSGGIIGGAISTAYYPLNVIKIRMQCNLGGPPQSPRSVYTTVLAERSGKFSELYRGVHLNYTRSALSWGIGNASFELIRKFLYKIQGKDMKDS